jgi:hypothetical protein
MKACINIYIVLIYIKDDKTVIKKECDDTVNQAPVINFPVFNTDSYAHFSCQNMVTC